MDEFEISRRISDYIKEICHYSQMQVFSTSSYQKKYFQYQIDEAVDELINLFLMNLKEERRKQNEYNQAFAQQQFIQQPLEQQTIGQQPSEAQPLPQTDEQQELKVITREELASNDGGSGRPAYVAVNGIVYNMSDAIRWAGGTHFGLYAGQDLSDAFMGCHRGMLEILNKYPVVGRLE